MRIVARSACVVFCLVWVALFLAQKIDLTTADLGRHLKNGESAAAFLIHSADNEKSKVFRFNTYSYTHPDFPVMNHHWGSGLLFHWVERAAGFTGLSVLVLGLLLGGWGLVFTLAVRRGGWAWAVAWSLWLVPVFAARREVRPEAFSIFFAACFLFLLEWHADGKIRTRSLGIILTVLQVLWANLHIYFVLGPLIAAVYAVGYQTSSQREGLRGPALNLWIIFLCVSAATVINPFGLRGVLYPLFIFGNYGYRLIENQSIPFLERLKLNFPHLLFFKTASAAVVCVALLEALTRRRLPRPSVVLALILTAAAWRALRNFQLFALFALPALSAACAGLTEFKGRLSQNLRTSALVLGVAAALASTVFIYQGHPFKPLLKSGIGLLPGAMRSADFFREEGLKGPIFNNYDVGGYLIYALWPDERVFVDNRPEAYPEAFFNQVLIPAQEDEGQWRRLDAQNRFNVIFFGYRDMTPWAQTFLFRRLADPEWAPVFVDNFVVIFLRRTAENASIIVRRELPPSTFRVIPGS